MLELRRIGLSTFRVLSFENTGSVAHLTPSRIEWEYGRVTESEEYGLPREDCDARTDCGRQSGQPDASYIRPFSSSAHAQRDRSEAAAVFSLVWNGRRWLLGPCYHTHPDFDWDFSSYAVFRIVYLMSSLCIMLCLRRRLSLHMECDEIKSLMGQSRKYCLPFC